MWDNISKENCPKMPYKRNSGHRILVNNRLPVHNQYFIVPGSMQMWLLAEANGEQGLNLYRHIHSQSRRVGSTPGPQSFTWQAAANAAMLSLYLLSFTLPSTQPALLRRDSHSHHATLPAWMDFSQCFVSLWQRLVSVNAASWASCAFIPSWGCKLTSCLSLCI